VASEVAVSSWASVNDPRDAALPTLVMWPVRLALVVTVAALPVVELEVVALPVSAPTNVVLVTLVSPVIVAGRESVGVVVPVTVIWLAVPVTLVTAVGMSLVSAMVPLVFGNAMARLAVGA
jgi:hypothetical protein